MQTSRSFLMRASGLLLCLLPLGFSALQDSDTDKTPPKSGPPAGEVSSDGRFFGPKGGLGKEQSFIKRIEGCWRLVSIQAEDYPSLGIDLLGYMVISGPFVALEVQAFWDNTYEEQPEDAFETFIGEFRASTDNAMEVQVLMGSHLDREEGSLEWYKSDRPERFALSLQGTETLNLEWRGRRKMSFRRVRPQATTARNFFGAPDASLTGVNDFYDDSRVPKEKPDPIEEDDQPDDPDYDDYDDYEDR